jgi:hypothetical protein
MYFEIVKTKSLAFVICEFFTSSTEMDCFILSSISIVFDTFRLYYPPQAGWNGPKIGISRAKFNTISWIE